jgi:conjugal transfer pilus assembly protein TraV
MPTCRRKKLFLSALAGLPLLLAGCAPLGALMSPYSEKFSCKNDDHGQCIDPQRAYEDARAGVASKSQAAVTNDRAKLKDRSATPAPGQGGLAYGSYRASVYRELQGLIDAPVTPMLRPARTVRTLILPYADRQRPDRLYMPRYVYSILDRPEWVIGSGLRGQDAGAGAPILGQSRERPVGAPDAAAPSISDPRP